MGQVTVMWYFCLHFRSKKFNHNRKIVKMMVKVKKEIYLCVCILNTVAHILKTVCHRDATGEYPQARWRRNKQLHITSTEHVLYKQNKLKLCLNYSSTSVTITLWGFKSTKLVQNSNFSTEGWNSVPFQGIFISHFSHI